MSTETFGAHIVAPMDVGSRSERAADLAGWLAASTGAELRLVSVVTSEREAPLRTAYLESVASSIESDVAVRATCETRVGRDVGLELEGCLGTDAGVVMSTSATRLPHGGHFGSIADRVVRAARRPITLIGPRAQPTFAGGIEAVVAAVDGSDVAERTVPVAGKLGQLLALPVYVLTVLPARANRSATAETAYVGGLADALASEGVTAHFDVLHDSNPTGRVLTSYRGGATIPVVASHGRTGLVRVVAGSVATLVVKTSRWPVVMVPSGD